MCVFKYIASVLLMTSKCTTRVKITLSYYLFKRQNPTSPKTHSVGVEYRQLESASFNLLVHSDRLQYADVAWRLIIPTKNILKQLSVVDRTIAYCTFCLTCISCAFCVSGQKRSSIGVIMSLDGRRSPVFLRHWGIRWYFGGNRSYNKWCRCRPQEELDTTLVPSKSTNQNLAFCSVAHYLRYICSVLTCLTHDVFFVWIRCGSFSYLDLQSVQWYTNSGTLTLVYICSDLIWSVRGVTLFVWIRRASFSWPNFRSVQ